jgi:hypothetical protein
MSTFDGPSRESCIVRRERTNTPLQALLLLNDPQYIEAARGLAERTINEGGATPADRAAFLFRLCAGRDPRQPEIDDLVNAYSEELAHYQARADAAERLASSSSLPLAPRLDRAEVAAWTMAANVMLNLDEVVTKN